MIKTHNSSESANKLTSSEGLGAVFDDELQKTTHMHLNYFHHELLFCLFSFNAYDTFSAATSGYVLNQ